MSVGPGAYISGVRPSTAPTADALPGSGGRWPGLSAEPTVAFAVRLLLISLPPSWEYKAESTLWGYRGRAGRCLVWDATVADTLAASYLANTSTTAGSAAEAAATRKQAKYHELSNTHIYIPLALETLGPINNTGMDFISDLSRSTGDPKVSSFLFQRLSISVQRFNAVAFRGTFTDSENRDYNTMTLV